MEKGYSAFGLALRSSFPLPGMAEAEAGGLPPLALELETPASLERAWSGSRSSQPWRGRLGDGNELTIAWGVDGDLLFDYGGGARFRLDPGRGRLGCAPLDSPALAWKRVLLSRVLPGVSLALGREALHAGAVEMPCGVVGIAAASGSGKSTLAAELMRRGAALFADDVLTLGLDDGAVSAYPGSPHANIGPGPAGSIEPEQLGSVLANFSGECWVGVRHASRGTCAIAAVVLLERKPGLQLAVEALDASPLALAPHMLGLPDDEPEREGSRFALYSDLVESTALLRLTAGLADHPADLADALERAIAAGDPAAMRAAA
jgi:hypothetical protein